MIYSPPDYRTEEKVCNPKETLIKINNSLARLPKTKPYIKIRLLLENYKQKLEAGKDE